MQVAVKVPRDDGVSPTVQEFFNFGKAGRVVI